MTLKQELAINIIKESQGKKPIGQAMIEAGYTKVSAKTPSNLTSSKAYQQAMAKIRAKHGVTLDKYVRNIGQAMDAEILDKANIPTGVPNHLVRLSGNKQAEKILQIDKHFGSSDGISVTPEDLSALASASDEVELTRLLFRKGS